MEGGGKEIGYIPLAERVRPEDWEDFVGQAHILPVLKELPPTSLIFWGPPGCGKTTAARILAKKWGMEPYYFSAVVNSIKEVKRVMEGDELLGAKLLFVDEIHRYNKAQQAAFLPYLEDGKVILVGTTTENPSFEVIPPLLSRLKVIKFDQLSPAELRKILKRGIRELKVDIREKAVEKIIELSGGDGRRVLNTLEIAAKIATGKITKVNVTQAAGEKTFFYDKAGDYHYDMISAYHKSLRNSDPDAAIYWLARMINAGEDMGPILRRLIMASVEDVSFTDPRAFEIAVNAFRAYEFLGPPEGELIIAYATIYVALSPKSNSTYKAWSEAKKEAKETSNKSVPLHLRNPVTKLMKEEGYGEGYMYAHDFEEGTTPMECLPEDVKKRFFFPIERGEEREISRRLRWFLKIKEKMKGKP